MELRNIIFHKVVTEQHKTPVEISPRDEILALPDKRADNLINAVLVNYEKESSLAYAGFINESWFPTKLDSLLIDGVGFYDFSVYVLKQLRQEMMKVPASTGGYLTIAHYELDGDEKLLLLLLKDKEGIGISKKLELEEVHTLNLDKLHVAATINITSWKEGKERYISFLKGKAKDKEVVGYFKALVNIDEDMYTDPAKHTRDLVNVIKNYCNEKLSDIEAGDARKRVHVFSLDKAEKDQSITLDEVANLLCPSDPNDFIDYVRSKKIEIPGEFKPLSTRLQTLVRYRVKGETTDYTLSFEHSAIEDNKIWLNQDEHLVISDVPLWLRKQVPHK
ncbi:TPA: nucleoid-associated protein [Vibrio parahaemolyticus]